MQSCKRKVILPHVGRHVEFGKPTHGCNVAKSVMQEESFVIYEYSHFYVRFVMTKSFLYSDLRLIYGLFMH